MVLSKERLDEYSRRLVAAGRGELRGAMLNVEVEDLVTEVQDLRKGLRRLRERVYNGAATGVIYAELLDLLEGKYK